MAFTETDIENMLEESEEENFLNLREDNRRSLEADLQRMWETVNHQRKQLKIKEYQLVIHRLQELLQQDPLPDLSHALTSANRHASDLTNEDKELIRIMEYECYYIEHLLEREVLNADN